MYFKNDVLTFIKIYLYLNKGFIGNKSGNVTYFMPASVFLTENQDQFLIGGIKQLEVLVRGLRGFLF